MYDYSYAHLYVRAPAAGRWIVVHSLLKFRGLLYRRGDRALSRHVVDKGRLIRGGW